jgi:hypothetical protein
MALLQETCDLAVGRDSLPVAGQRGHGPEAIAEPEPDRAPCAGRARFPTGVEAAKPGRQRVEEGDEVDAPVGHPLVLEHQHRRAAGV